MIYTYIYIYIYIYRERLCMRLGIRIRTCTVIRAARKRVLACSPSPVQSLSCFRAVVIRPISELRFWISEGVDSSIILVLKGWNSHVQRECPRHFESRNLSRGNLSRVIGRTSWMRSCGPKHESQCGQSLLDVVTVAVKKGFLGFCLRPSVLPVCFI